MVSLMLLSLNAQAAQAQSFYVCWGFAGVEEYRVGINLDNGKAVFFDNDTNSYLNLSEVKTLESHPVQVQYVFEGKDEGAAGDLKLYFNQTRMNASLYNVYKNGKYEKLGWAKCHSDEPWSDLE